MKKPLVLGVGGVALFAGTVLGMLALQGRLNHEGTQGIPVLSSFFPAAPQPDPGHEPSGKNDKSDKNVVNVREYCDTRNCELDASTIAGEYPDNTDIRVVSGSNVQTARFTWVKVVVTATGRTVWVASTKIKCT